MNDRDLASIQNARDLAHRARAAARNFAGATQDQVDRIVDAMARAATREAEPLARAAVAETGMGNVEGKTAKNLFVSEHLHGAYRELRTCGVVAVHREYGVVEVASPVGVVAGVIPSTNPTSTAIFKALIAVKGRNPVVLSPHPGAEDCIRRTSEVLADAAVSAGAPKDVITCMTAPSLEGTHELMRHRETDVIVATGGPGVVQAAYSSGKPAFGVGPGNTPVFVHSSADLEHTARCLVLGQNFDFGTICSSEQSLVVEESIADRFRTALEAQDVHFCSADETAQLERTVQHPDGRLNTSIVGQSAPRVAELAGFEVPARTTILVAPGGGVGPAHALSRETLCPLLAWYTVPDWQQGCKLCIQLIAHGGSGHTMGVHSRDNDVVIAFGIEKPVSRIIVNAPTTQGAIGLATALQPSMTLGCGSMGGNITSDNIGPAHLIDIKRIAYPRAAFFADHGLPLAVEDADPGGFGSGSWSEDPCETSSPGHSALYREGEVQRMTEEMALRALSGGRVPPPRDYYLRS